jgi:two-component system LytT family response regulator
MIRTLIVDDEAPARQRLQRLLAAMPEIEIVGEAANGLEAIERVGELKPDLLLLDIQMPGATGLEVVASLPRPRPRIVFCTAFDHYAVKAFELQAVDYLLKPINRVRLAQAIERIREQPAVDAERDVDRVLGSVREKCTRFLANCGDRFRVIPEADTVYISSEDGLTRLNTRERQYLLQPTLNELEERLDQGKFFRISRAAMVNLDFITEVRPMPGGMVDVLLQTGVTLPVSRRRVKNLLARIEGTPCFVEDEA